MHRCKVSMDLEFCLSEQQFSLDILVIKLSELFQSKAFCQILRLVLMLVEEILVLRLLKGRGEACPCGGGRWTLNGSFTRRLRTSLGAVVLPFRRVKCSSCGKTLVPLQRLLRLGRYQTRTNELERLVVDAVSETSYRRTVAMLTEAGVAAPPFRTAHDWVLRTGCDEIDIPRKVLEEPLTVFADGTGFKGVPQDGKAAPGDLKAVVGVTRGGRLVPMGSWAGKSWQEIHDLWKQGRLVLADGSILVCDGELGLSAALAGFASEQQRCQWHVTRDLYHAMHQDGGGAKEARPFQKRLAGVMALELPADDFEKVAEEDRLALQERTRLAEAQVDSLVAELYSLGYCKAADYLERAGKGMFGYVRRWLKWGLVSPKASSMIERVMRELGRRIKKIAYGWSDRGVAKIARIILKRFANKAEWEKYWQEKFGDNLSVVILLRNLKGSSQDFAH